MAALAASFPAVTASGVTSVTATNNAPIPAGATICVVGRSAYTTSTNVTVSDSANGSYTRADLVASSNSHSFFFQNTVASATGAVTMTFTTDLASGAMRLMGDVISGVAKTGGLLGHTAQAPASAATSIAGTAITGDPGGGAIWTGWTSPGTLTGLQASPGSSNGASLGLVQMYNGGGSLVSQWGSPTIAGTQAASLSWNYITNNVSGYFQMLLAPDASAASSATPALAGTFDPALNPQAWF